MAYPGRAGHMGAGARRATRYGFSS